MTTQELMDALQATKRDYEREWFDWLLSLPAWERHYVFLHCELDWHDDYVSGEADFDVFRVVLDARFAELTK